MRKKSRDQKRSPEGAVATSARANATTTPSFNHATADRGQHFSRGLWSTERVSGPAFRSATGARPGLQRTQPPRIGDLVGLLATRQRIGTLLVEVNHDRVIAIRLDRREFEHDIVAARRLLLRPQHQAHQHQHLHRTERQHRLLSNSREIPST